METEEEYNYEKKFLTGLMVFVMMAMSFIPAFAQNHQTIRLPKNKVWMTAGDTSRSGNYSYVRASCDSVYPIQGNDTFQRIQVRVKDTKGHVISVEPYTVLKEGAGQKNVTLKEGYLAARTVKFQFRGNSDAEAYAVVNYYGL